MNGMATHYVDESFVFSHLQGTGEANQQEGGKIPRQSAG